MLLRTKITKSHHTPLLFIVFIHVTFPGWMFCFNSIVLLSIVFWRSSLPVMALIGLTLPSRPASCQVLPVTVLSRAKRREMKHQTAAPFQSKKQTLSLTRGLGECFVRVLSEHQFNIFTTRQPLPLKTKQKKPRKPKTQQVKFRYTHCESPPLSPHTPLYCFRRGDYLDFHDRQRRSSMLT